MPSEPQLVPHAPSTSLANEDAAPSGSLLDQTSLGHDLRVARRTGKPRLALRERVGYALGDAGSNFYWKVFEFFILYYYTDVFGLSAGAAATLLLVARVWDAVNDPLMGVLADRTRSRWGKFRPWLLWFAIPIALSGVAMFTVPDLGPNGKLAYAYATYILMMMMYTAINIPYSALMAVVTPDSQERAQLSSFRFIGAFGVALVVQSYTPSLVDWLAPGDPQAGWQRIMMVYGAIAAVLFVGCFAATRERVEPPKNQTENLREDVSALLRNGPWKVMFVLGVLVITGFAVRGGTLMYYFKYYLHAPERFETFMLAAGVAALMGTIAMPRLAALIGRRRLYIVCMGSSGLLSCVLYFLPAEDFTTILIVHTTVCLLLGPTAALMFVMFSDTSDYGEYKTGRRTTGLVMAAAMLSLKFGGAIGGYANGMVLQWTGFVANQEQTTEAIRGILFLMGIAPGITGVLAALLATQYRLDDKTMSEVSQTLAMRREPTGTAGQAAAQPSS